MAAALAIADALRPFSRGAVGGFPAFTAGLWASEMPGLVGAMVGAAAMARGRGRRSGTDGRHEDLDARSRPGAAAAGLTGVTAAGLVALDRRIRRSGPALEAALESVGVPPAETVVAPGFAAVLASRRRYVSREDTIRYDTADPGQVLDVWRRPDLPRHGCAPVVVQVPGGAWVTGSHRGQAYPLLTRLVERGWVCVSMGYRLSPRHRWPAHLVDVKRVLAWTRANISRYGGDASWLGITGGSAGAHLAALAALTANDPAFQPGFVDDTSVDAAALLYGRYDWVGRDEPGQAGFVRFLERYVVGEPSAAAPDVFRGGSPLHQVHPGAPPTLVLHGDRDSIIPVEQARAFTRALRDVSRSPVAYAELPGAQHAFDILPSRRAAMSAAAVERFLDEMRETRRP